MNRNESNYLETFLKPIRKCKKYRPKFGHGKKVDGFTVQEFKALYGTDPFYSWIGLDSDHMYAAHRAAGGMTSVYRQIGIGCERLFRAVIADSAEYTASKFANWSYTTKTPSGKTKKLSLDGRLMLSEIRNDVVLANVQNWINAYCEGLTQVTYPGNGVVFEVRQGYKSKDSKRQNADIDNATVAWANDYLPVFAIFSSQIDTDIVLRYRNSRCGILVGLMNDDAQSSLYAFCDRVLGYDLADFFYRKSAEIRIEITDILETLLTAR